MRRKLKRYQTKQTKMTKMTKMMVKAGTMAWRKKYGNGTHSMQRWRTGK